MLTVLIDTIQNDRFQNAFQEAKVGNSYNRRQRMVWHYLLAEYLNWPLAKTYGETNFVYSTHGKPGLKTKSFHYNIAHSYDLVTLSISDRPIGADIEMVRDYDYLRIKRGFRFEEINYLASLSSNQQSRMALKLWTIKEAVLKLSGEGIAGGVRSVKINLQTLQTAERFGRKIKLIPLNIGERYVGTIAQYQDQYIL